MRVVPRGINMSEELETEEIVEPEAINAEAYERTKNDMHAFKRKFMDTQKQLEDFQGKFKELEEKNLEGNNNYKELWEKERTSKADIEGKLKSLTGNILEDKKMSKLKEEALKNGIDEDFLDMLDAFDTSDILVETTSSGQFVVNGADTWVEALKSTKPKMFKQKVDPTINNKTGNYDGKDKTYSSKEVLALQKTDPDKYQEIITKKRHLIKN